MELRTFVQETHLSESSVHTLCQSLQDSPKCRHFKPEEFNRIDKAVQIALDFHIWDLREISEWLVVDHLIAMIKEVLWEGKEKRELLPGITITSETIIVLLLNQTLVIYPDRYREIYDFVWMDLFCRILKLSNLRSDDRQIIYEFLYPEIEKNPKYTSILDLLSYQYNVTWEYKHRISEDNKSIYDDFLLKCRNSLDEHSSHLTEDEKNTKLLGLFNVMFFDSIDAINKLCITFYNLKDINIIGHIEMTVKADGEEILITGPRAKRMYLKNRIPKCQALSERLVSLGMFQELEILKDKWEVVWWWFDKDGNFLPAKESNFRFIESVRKKAFTIQKTPPAWDVISI